ncbi:MAG: hypothetical protein HQ534_08695 [Armatimonadetes bacterium]|nr:hypothetical protein [Armatimonadota bacterium]
MRILKELFSSIPAYPVKEVFAGVFDILVWSQNLGIATTVMEEQLPHAGIRNSKNLLTKNTRELAEYVFSENWLEASLGMAAINSALPIRTKARIINAQEIILQKGREKKVGIIGHFPFVEKFKNQFEELFVFEKNPRNKDLCEKEIPNFLPQADVIAISSTTLTNHTFENIMQNIKKDSFVILLGPTSPVSPILFDFGIDAVSGVYFDDNEKSILTQVKEATPYRFIKGKKYVTIFREDYIG